MCIINSFPSKTVLEDLWILLKFLSYVLYPEITVIFLQGYVLAVEQDIQTKKCTLYHPKIPDVNISDQLTWIALMQRNGCKFDEMVAIIQNLIKECELYIAENCYLS